MRCDDPRTPGAPPILKRAERPERHRGCEDRSPRCVGVLSLDHYDVVIVGKTVR